MGLRLRLATSLLAGISNLCWPLTCAAQSGLVYDFQATKKTVPPTKVTLIVTGHASLEGNKLRVDLRDGGTGTAKMKDYYMLGSEGARKLIWINATRKEFYEVTAGLGDAGIILPQSDPEPFPRLDNIHISVTNVGDGPLLQGHPTAHYRYSQEMDAISGERGSVTHNRFQVEYFYPADMPNFLNPLMFRAVFSGPSDAPKDYMQKVREEIAKLPESAPLRSIYRDEEVNRSGQTKAEITVFEVSHLHSANLPPKIFDVPADFRRIPPPHKSGPMEKR